MFIGFNFVEIVELVILVDINVFIVSLIVIWMVM